MRIQGHKGQEGHERHQGRRAGFLLSLLSLTSFLSLSVPALGLEPYLVKDINPVAKDTGSSPSSFASLGNVGVFTAFDGEGLGLWRSDGTAAGTWQVADLCPEASPSCGAVVILAVADGRCFLGLGTGVWVTDGTTAGTLHLTDDLSSVSFDAAWVPEQRVLYFAGTDIAHGQELWRTDGTPAGTYRVVDLEPGPKPSLPLTLTAFRGQVWFGARTGAQGSAIWRSDGTERGTVPVYRTGRQVLPVVRGVVGKRLLFTEPFGRDGHRLWSTDGTAGGTRMVRDLCPGTCGSDPRDPARFKGRLLFSADDGTNGRELWSTDGTIADTAGTVRITDLTPDDPVYSFQGVAVAGRFLFAADDGASGSEPWSTDGTLAGTQLLADINQTDFGGSAAHP